MVSSWFKKNELHIVFSYHTSIKLILIFSFQFYICCIKKQMIMIELNVENWSQVIDNNESVLVDVYGSACPPCKVIEARLTEVEKNHGNSVFFAKIEVFSNVEKYYEVDMEPTTIDIKHKKTTIKELKSFINETKAEPHDTTPPISFMGKDYRKTRDKFYNKSRSSSTKSTNRSKRSTPTITSSSPSSSTRKRSKRSSSRRTSSSRTPSSSPRTSYSSRTSSSFRRRTRIRR